MSNKSGIGKSSTEFSVLLVKLKLHGLCDSSIISIFLSFKMLEFLSSTLKSDTVPKLPFSIITASSPSLASQLSTISNFAASFSLQRLPSFSAVIKSSLSLASCKSTAVSEISNTLSSVLIQTPQKT